jgi:homogentisate 1,2-dioxygenase
MPIYHTLGRVPRKRHTAMRKPDGGIYSEQLVGHEGFTGTSALLYHVHPPTTVKSARKLRDLVWEASDDDALKHRHWRTAQLPRGGSPTLDRTPMLFNADIAMLHAAPDREDEHHYRNAQADEVVYVAKGSGVLESQFGELPYREGDYVVVHRGILHRWRLDPGVEQRWLVMESRGHVRWPKRYRNEFGQLVEGAPYSERDIRRPEQLVTHDEMGDFRILIKQSDALQEYYASEEFMSRKGIEFGSVTHHPDGIPHGPHPGRYEASIGQKWTNELAVMMDSFRPLKVAKAVVPAEDPGYHRSWIEAQHERAAGGSPVPVQAARPPHAQATTAH